MLLYRVRLERGRGSSGRDAAAAASTGDDVGGRSAMGGQKQKSAKTPQPLKSTHTDYWRSGTKYNHALISALIIMRTMGNIICIKKSGYAHSMGRHRCVFVV